MLLSWRVKKEQQGIVLLLLLPLLLARVSSAAAAAAAAASAAAAATASSPPSYPPLARPPQFTMDTLGGMTFAHVTKPVAFNDTDLALLSKYQVVQFDKSQDVTDMAGSTLEDRFIHAAQQIKQVNPKSVTLCYFNGLINFPAFQRLANATRADPSLLLHNVGGKRVDTLSSVTGTFDMRQKRMRELFVADAMYAIGSGVFDGVFIDRANFASRAVLELRSGTKASAHLAALGWDIPTALSLAAAQTQLFADLTSALDPRHIVLAKETGGGAPFNDWMHANAAMTTDTFCSSYLPAGHGHAPAPASFHGNASCSRWSPPIQGHVPLNGSTIWDGQNESSFAQCEAACCRKGDLCAAVLYNTQIKKCVHLPEPFTTKFTCKNGTGVEWLANKLVAGPKTCGRDVPPPPPPLPNATTMWNATDCYADMLAVTAMASRQQMTESHGQGPLSDDVQREFTMACFLIAAGNFSYFSYASWDHGKAWSLKGTRWWHEYQLRHTIIMVRALD
jgi:hypothetical protein